jgi:hypothetical protein
MPLAQAPLSAFAGGGSEADEGFLDSQSGRFGGQVAQAMTARARDVREPLKRTVLDPERGAQRRKNNEIKFGNQHCMAFVPVLSHAALPGAARARTAGRVHAVLGRKPDAPPGGRSSVTAT